MTLNPVLPTITADEARRLTERIRLTAHSARESIEKLHSLVDEAKAGNAHVALGFQSWTAYLSDVLGEEPLRLASDRRPELVAYLAGEGMSERAIAPIVGVSPGQVHKDKATASSGSSRIEQPATVTSLDGRERPARRPEVVQVDTETGEVLDAKPRATPRRALTDQFFDANYDLTKAVERVERLADDDRFIQNAEKVAAKHRNDLLRAIDALQGVVDRLPQPETKDTNNDQQ